MLPARQVLLQRTAVEEFSKGSSFEAPSPSETAGANATLNARAVFSTG